MAVSCICDQRALTATLSGELDHHAAKHIMTQLDGQIDRELPRQLTIDMGAVTFTDSSGIAVLLRAHRQMCRLEGELRVVNVPSQAKRVFQAAGLGRIIRFE
ncbi:MAG: anti-sigma factor antagonist [Oscillospiraceae bacterium]|nr:anti-sigma factor antagonist [Oscillospiraceae bacterium]MBO5918211.1 anti-sigma factor antagonist [Oscillospiraceae bacterium]